MAGNPLPRVGFPAMLAAVAAIIAATVLVSPRAQARGPESIADVAEKVIDAVVNVSTSQSVDTHGTASPSPQLPPGSPFEEFFDEFFKNRRGQQGENNQNRPNSPRRVNSLGSGFIIDPSGIVVTNNHVITDADEVTVILNDGTRLKAEIIGRDTKVDLALLRVKADKPLTAVSFGDSDKLRLGEWVVAIGNPFSLGGSVTAGIVSARNRDIQSGPYDNYIQTDAAINRGNSGGPLFNLEGEVIGINTAIISPSGGSIGIGFAVPSKTAVAVIDQLRQYGETRRGWLGVRIQQVTDDVAESLNIKPPRGALVAGVDPAGPSKGVVETGDVIIRFDGKDIKEMKDLPRIVADTPVGKDVEVTVVRKGKEESRTVKLGRLEDGEKQAALTPSKEAAPPEKTVVQKTLGLNLANMSDELRKRFKIKDTVRGVVITGVDSQSPAAEKRLNPGDVVVEVSQETVADADALQKRVDQLKKDGRRTALLLVANADGELRFVALSLQ
jgi:serine protease Do